MSYYVVLPGVFQHTVDICCHPLTLTCPGCLLRPHRQFALMLALCLQMAWCQIHIKKKSSPPRLSLEDGLGWPWPCHSNCRDVPWPVYTEFIRIHFRLRYLRFIQVSLSFFFRIPAAEISIWLVPVRNINYHNTAWGIMIFVAWPQAVAEVLPSAIEFCNILHILWFDRATFLDCFWVVSTRYALRSSTWWPSVEWQSVLFQRDDRR